VVKVFGVGVNQIFQIGILVGRAYGEGKSPGRVGGVVKGLSRRRHCEDRASLLVGVEVHGVKENGRACRTALGPACRGKDVRGK
jgi:hypothetical protein